LSYLGGILELERDLCLITVLVLRVLDPFEETRPYQVVWGGCILRFLGGPNK